MLGKATIAAFLATANAKRSKAFYASTLGLRLIEDDDLRCCSTPMAFSFESKRSRKCSLLRSPHSDGKFPTFGEP